MRSSENRSDMDNISQFSRYSQQNTLLDQVSIQGTNQSMANQIDDHEHFLKWVDDHADLFNEDKIEEIKQIQEQKQMDHFSQEVEDDYKIFKQSKEKYFGPKGITPEGIDKQIEKFLYRRIDPHRTMKRLYYSKAPSVSPYAIYNDNKSELSKLVNSMIETEMTKPKRPFTSTRISMCETRKSDRIRSATTRQFSAKTTNTRYQPSRKDILVKIQQSQRQPLTENDSRRRTQEIENDEIPPPYYQPKQLTMKHVQPPFYNKLRKPHRWWPLKDIQKFFVERYNNNVNESDEEDGETQQIPYKPQIKRVREKKITQTFSVRDSNLDPLNESIKIIRQCNNYLSNVEHVKRLLKEKEEYFNWYYDRIELNEDETNEKEYEKEQKQYQQNEAAPVIKEFKKHSRHKVGFKMYNHDHEKKKKTQTKKLIETIK